MDLTRLDKKAILIPTPGQTEQAYLAKYLMEKNFFYAVEQKHFVLDKAVGKAAGFPFLLPDINMNYYKIIIKEFVQSFHSTNLQTQ